MATQEAGDNPYKVLGVDPSASDTRVKAAYRRAVLRWHPDRNLDNQQEATERFKQITQAWQDISKHRWLNQNIDDEKWWDAIYKEYIEPDKIKRAAQRQREQARPVSWNPELHAGHVATAVAAKQIGISWITLQRWAGPNSDRLKGIIKVPPLVYKDRKVVRLWSPKQVARLKKALPNLRYKRHAKPTGSKT